MSDKKQAWTPGRWFVDNRGPQGCDILAEDMPLTQAKRIATALPWPNAEANAKLMAQAPAMAEALVEFIAAFAPRSIRQARAIDNTGRILKEAGVL